MFRGICQGDSPYPFLFKTTAEGLSKLVRRAFRLEESNAKNSGDCESCVSNLPYIDDTFLLLLFRLEIAPPCQVTEGIQKLGF